MKSIVELIAKKTDGHSFKTSKYCFDTLDIHHVDYEVKNQKVWKRNGENPIPKESYISIEAYSNDIKHNDPLFKFFLDGSRKTYKVDDISYNRRVYPIIAGQIGIGCCLRENKKICYNDYFRELVISVPHISTQDERNPEKYFNNLLDDINSQEYLKNLNIKFDNIIPYESGVINHSEEMDYEKKGIAKIQDRMVDLEKIMVAKLVKEKKINYNNYLLKDGSLEYRKFNVENSRELSNLQNNYRYVIGVSKSFNPESCVDSKGKSNSTYIADIPLFNRTPAFMYEHNMGSETVYFAIWYVRIRDKKYTYSPFEGIIKVEKLLTEENEKEFGLDSDTIDSITANLINERNPVCYRADNRWANHLYPVFLTEKYLKCKFLSNNFFLNLF